MHSNGTSRRPLGVAAALAALLGSALAGGELESPAVSPSLPAGQATVEMPAASKPASASKDMRVFWNHGVRFETADKAFTAEFGGRVHVDWVWHSADDEVEAAFGEFDDGVKFRRARMHIAGKMYEHLAYKIEFDFASGEAGFRDVYLATSMYDIGTIKVGHYKEPFGLEQLTSSNNITFIERSLPDVFTPAFNTGLSVGNHIADDRATWALGVFRTTGDQGEDVVDDGGYAFTGRLTYLPMYQDGGEHLVHLGLSGSFRDADKDEVQIRQRPENSFAPRLVDTGAFEADEQLVYALEAAFVRDSLSIQGEYMMSDVSSDVADDPTFSGYYGLISYFLTGERRPYKRSSGAFDRVVPQENWGPDGCGAWELALRYSSLDLEDGAIDGGTLDDITAGVNWYLNPSARVMLNYVISEVENGAVDEDAEAALLRFQVTF